MSQFTVVLTDPTNEREPETVFESDDLERVGRWVRRWLDDPCGFAVTVIPPTGKAAARANSWHMEPPPLFAVIDTTNCRVLARGIGRDEAKGFVRSWRKQGGKARAVRERVAFQPAETLLELAAG